MQNGRTRRIVAAGVWIVAALVAAVTIGEATGRLPPLQKAWDQVSSSAASAFASSFAPAPQAPSASTSAPATTASHESGAAHAPDAAVAIHRQTAPLSSAQLGAPLVHGSFVAACGAPDDMKIVVNVTVKLGRATQVTAKTDPPNPTVAACIERATRDLQWDVSPKTEHVTVTY